MDTTPLPLIERWWPQLDIPAKQWLLAHDAEPLPPHIIEEICALCGVDVPASDEIRLSVSERNFIATQMETVD